MDKNTKNRKILGWLMLIMAAVIMIVTAIISSGIKRPEVGAKMVQHAVKEVEKDIQNLIDNNSNYHQYDLAEVGLYIFHNDSLLYWNNNLVGPKLIRRKVQVNNDTICNLLTGDYYVRTFSKGNLNYYVFKLINTTYRLENTFLKNRFVPFDGIIDSKVTFTEDNGYIIQSTSGKHLVNCRIETMALSLRFKTIVFGIALLLFIVAIMLLMPRRTTSNPFQKYRVEYGIAAILLIAITSTYIYYKQNSKKENAEMAAIAEHLLVKRDIAFEDAFQQFAKDIKNDTSFQEILFAESNVLADVVLGYSKELLFDETMKEYHATLTICLPEDYIDIQPDDTVVNCDDFFLEKLAKNSQKRVGEGLYFMDYNTLDPNYLSKIKVLSTDSLQQRTLYFEFYKPIAPEGFGFPLLLQEKNSEKPYEYSVASYRDNILVYKYGKYIYPNFLKDINIKDRNFTYGNSYKHYSINNGENNVLIISTPRKGWSEISGPFAIFFLGLLLPYLFVYWLLRPKKQKPWKDRSFRQRLQTVIFVTLGVAFLAIGPVSVVYMRSIYNQKTMSAQYETTRTLAMEMQNNIDFRQLLTETTSRETWSEIMQHYANIFFTDLNLYSLDGKLIATTRPEIYELTLQAPIMNAEAYQNMFRNKALYYTHKEQIGKGIYESSYLPITDTQGNTLAFLNTSYFSSETDFQKEIKAFMLTYINIILVLLGLALIFVMVITKRLTQPLSLIQNKLGDIKIDQKNEPIEWKRNDEIGALVKQYNQLIVELEKSAAELKRTTAESAWRGVARQVAHEIKNSLTPMRLSVQLLQRNIDNGKATPEQIQRTTNTLIEQIDALSDIASSFSRYAKLPENHPQPLDLAELVGNVVNLYDNTENIEFNYEYDKTQDHTYNGDKTNLNSAIGNIIKNATQAIGSKPDGRIDVILKSTETQFVISVKDNGKGIKEEDKSQIFLPNFTTKSGGSGVGLSLTYNIVQSAGGTITFESQEGEGAEFIIELPKN